MDQDNLDTPAAGDQAGHAETDAHGIGSAANEPDAAVSRRRWIAGAIAAVGVALFAVPFIGGPGVADHRDAAGGDVPAAGSTCAAPKGTANFDLTLTDIDGKTVPFSEYKGKVILLNFWATWCGPCRIEIPEFVEAYDAYRDRGFVILGVLSQDDAPADDLKTFASQWRMNYPMFRENLELDEAFGSVYAIPTSFIIDRQGSICTKHMGPVSKEMLEREIKRLL